MRGYPLERPTISATLSKRLSTYLNRRLLWSLLACIYLLRRLTGTDRSMLVVPTRPTRWHVLWLISAYLGVRITVEPEQTQIGCVHDDHTWVEPPRSNARWPKIVLNARCLDISKRRVAELHQEVFGYHCNVDPTTYVGLMVKKSNINGIHDGEIISGPIDEEKEGYVYQYLIDNRISEYAVADYRLSVIDGTFPFAVIKRRPISVRFQGPQSSFEIVDASTLFSKDELTKISEIAGRIGLDFGEIDVLREPSDGCIHVIDVNKTPAYLILSWKTSFQVVRKAARLFEKQFLSPPTQAR